MTVEEQIRQKTLELWAWALAQGLVESAPEDDGLVYSPRGDQFISLSSAFAFLLARKVGIEETENWLARAFHTGVIELGYLDVEGEPVGVFAYTQAKKKPRTGKPRRPPNMQRRKKRRS